MCRRPCRPLSLMLVGQLLICYRCSPPPVSGPRRSCHDLSVRAKITLVCGVHARAMGSTHRTRHVGTARRAAKHAPDQIDATIPSAGCRRAAHRHPKAGSLAPPLTFCSPTATTTAIPEPPTRKKIDHYVREPRRLRRSCARKKKKIATPRRRQALLARQPRFTRRRAHKQSASSR